MLPDVTAPDGEYGLPKDDYDFVIDPRTEHSAAEIESEAVDCSAMTHTAIRAWVSVDAHATTSAILDHDAVWGGTGAVVPTLLRNGTGDYSLTWTAGGYPDLNPTPDRRETRPMNFRSATACVAESSAGVCTVVKTSSNAVRVRVYDSTFAAADLDFDVWLI